MSEWRPDGSAKFGSAFAPHRVRVRSIAISTTKSTSISPHARRKIARREWTRTQARLRRAAPTRQRHHVKEERVKCECRHRWNRCGAISRMRYAHCENGPGSPLVAIATLGFGIGASTAIFSVDRKHFGRAVSVSRRRAVHDRGNSRREQGRMPPAAPNIPRPNISTTSRKIMFSISRSPTRQRRCSLSSRRAEWSGFTACC